MFESEVLRDVDEDGLVAVIEQRARQESMEAAQRLAAIAELTSRRCDKEGVRAHWACDGWDSVAGEVAAALGVSPKKASSQMTLSLALRHRIPKVAALFAQGKVSYRVITVINWRTHLVDSEDAMAQIDAKLAQRAESWDELSDYKLAVSIDYWVNRFDPDAVHRVRTTARSRDLHVGKRDDESETTAVWGRLYASDAAALDRRLMAIAETVCEDDPRSTAQRRADAVGVLTAGGDRLACSCGNPDCLAASSDGRASNVVIHVVTEAAALDAVPDPQMDRDDVRTPVSPAKPAGVLITGHKIVPAPLLAELIRSGAKVREVQTPCEAAESGYRPSAKLEEFVRVRDLTCRFPGCEEPAEFCDIDHTIPYPVGPTHPSNLKALCRKHHLLKTFWTGIGGWADRQLPDGTVVWTAPTGRTYKTLPGSRVFFPAWDTTTAELPKVAKPAASAAPLADRGVMMPKRRRTRAAERAKRIQEERKLNTAERAKWAQQAAKVAAARNKPPPAEYWDFKTSDTADDDDPPPF